MSDGIRVSGLQRSFRDIHALRDASFEAQPGSITALVGPNGAGKTTLLLMLATLLAPDAGEIRVAGFDPVREPAQVRMRMGWMPDILDSWAALSVRTTLEITGRMYHLDKRAAAERATELIDLVSLEPHAGQPTRVLSRGQKQRLSLARALVHDPSVLLLDEPASGLDPAARVRLRLLLKRLAFDGKTILISSHVLSELDEVADAAVYLDEGRTASAEAVARAKERLRTWRIRALHPDRLATTLAASEEYAGRISIDNLGTLVAVAGEREAAALLTALIAEGVEITSFAPAVGDLEHTLLDLSGSGA
ncbi:MAG: type transport system ATP-binding protein [Microbacteriaceae bacterium]|nr:type transport system ATP-binding protein [Microbacteriaceae bacterium]